MVRMSLCWPDCRLVYIVFAVSGLRRWLGPSVAFHTWWSMKKVRLLLASPTRPMAVTLRSGTSMLVSTMAIPAETVDATLSHSCLFMAHCWVHEHLGAALVFQLGFGASGEDCCSHLVGDAHGQPACKLSVCISGAYGRLPLVAVWRLGLVDIARRSVDYVLAAFNRHCDAYSSPLHHGCIYLWTRRSECVTTGSHRFVNDWPSLLDHWQETWAWARRGIRCHFCFTLYSFDSDEWVSLLAVLCLRWP